MDPLYENLKKEIGCDTDAFDPVLEEMYSPWEAQLVTALGSGSFSVSQAAEKLAIPEPEARRRLAAAHRKGILNQVGKEPPVYCAVDLYLSLDLFVLSDPERWRRYPKAFIQAADHWYFTEYGKRVEQRMQTEETRPSELVLPLEDALAYLDTMPDDLVLIPCDCKSIAGHCDHLREVCIHGFDADDPNSLYARGIGRRITRQEAREIVKEADADGLIHSPTSYHYCNCCTDCCYPMRYSKIRDSRGRWPESFYVAEIDPERCVGCGLCGKRCPCGAISVAEGKGAINAEHCIGCGVCRVPCKKEAIAMKSIRPVHFHG